MKFTKKIANILNNGTRDERAYICAKHFKPFAYYYFRKYRTHPPAPFHSDFYQDFEDLVRGIISEAAWVAMRDSAKTSIAGTMGLTWIVCRKVVIDSYKKKGINLDDWGMRDYVNVDAYDKSNAENILYDLTEELQTNEDIIADFGQLYNEQRSKDEVTLKRISKFNTTNKIRFEAHTAMTPVRGRKFGHRRPNFILRDDLENAVTVRSAVKTEALIEVLNEGVGGKAQHAAELTLGNYIIENGVVGYIMKKVKASGGRVRFIPAVYKDGTLAWPGRHVKTDAELLEANKGITDPARKLISLESKRREMNGGGMRVYEVEMLLDPVAAGSPFFTRRKIEALREKTIAPIDEVAGFQTWDTYNPSHRYAIGADTAKGNGGDHNASVLIDFSIHPAQQVGSYANNMIPADLFGHELARQGKAFGHCLLAPEKNTESGGSCLTTLRSIYPTKHLYVQVQDDKVRATFTEYGWETNSATKYAILDALRTAVEDGQLFINDDRILVEMRSFTHTDADELGKNRVGHFTNHFDLLMACAIAWEMRKYARVSTPTTSNYEQQAYERPGI